MNKPFSKGYLLDTTMLHLCREQFYQSYCFKHLCITEPMSWNKCVNMHSEENILRSWPILQNCCLETTVEEVKQYKMTLMGQLAQRLVSRLVKYSPLDWRIKIETFRLNVKGYIRRRVGERAEPLLNRLTIKHGEGSFMALASFCQLQSQSFAPSEWQIESDRLSEHTTASCNPKLEHGLW